MRLMRHNHRHRNKTAGPRHLARRDDRGSTLVLAPVGVMILLLLATMTADGALALLAQRQLSDALTSATTDAAGASIDRATFYATGQVGLSAPAAATAVCESLDAQGDLHLRDLQLSIGVSGAEVTVTATAQIRGIFGRALPGYHDWRIAASATATAEQARMTPPPPLPATTPLRC
jgi:hypothetical protein